MSNAKSPAKAASALHHARLADMQAPLLEFLDQRHDRAFVEEVLYRLRARADRVVNPMIKREWEKTCELMENLLAAMQ